MDPIVRGVEVPSGVLSTTLRRSSTGDPVRVLQELLKAHGFSVGPTDGDFGDHTEAAVRTFQQSHALKVDGVVAANTWRELVAVTPDAGTTSDPIPPTATPGARVLLGTALAELGNKEEPDGSNSGPRIDVYTGNWHVAWCALFVDWCLGEAHLRTWPKRMARVVAVRDWARERGRLEEVRTYVPRPGDLFLQLEEGQAGVDPSHGHVGIVLRFDVKTQSIQTVEGNCSNAVRSRSRPLSSINYFVRVLIGTDAT